MAKGDRTSGMKSAYELALERLESRGIERPSDLDEATRARIAEVRQKAEAELAKLEILHRDKLRGQHDPDAIHRVEEEYAIDRRRIEDRRDRDIERLREDA